MNLFADAGAGPGKSFLLPFRQPEAPEYDHLGLLVETMIIISKFEIKEAPVLAVERHSTITHPARATHRAPR